MFVAGRMIDFVLTFAILIVGFYLIMISNRWSKDLRTIPAVLAIEEAVGRATELGRPVHVTSGMGGSLSQTETGPQIMAALSVFSEVIHLAARNNVKLIASVGQADTLGILEEHVKDAYTAEGLPIPDMADTLRFHTNTQWAFVSAVTGIMRRERPAANIVIGPFYAESAQLVISGFQVGAMQIFGTARPSQIPLFAAFADYVLIGEEIYAAGAQIVGDREVTNTLITSDLGKALSIIIIVVGMLLAMVGSDVLKELMVM